MQVRILTSFADGPFSYVEGAILALPTPLPTRFQRYLQQRLVAPVRGLTEEVTLAPVAVEQAVARRAPGRTGGRRRAPAATVADDGP